MIDEENNIGPGTVVHEKALLNDCNVGPETEIWAFVNAYECVIGAECMIGPYVELQSDVTIGDGVSVRS
jgi:bifunctional N-acetylglucosamine-1-phosphate-uridyltransferase/glucosamine-1-phosphate-acetyltransferase GlmU-like protein